MDEKLISIIVPVYNVEKYLDKCIASIVKQTAQNLEIILVDDGSIDCSGKKCDKWAQKDNRIKVIHKANGGLSDARNVGLKQATGKLIGFVDSDDYIHEKMFERLAEDLKKYEADIAICKIQDVNEKGMYFGNSVEKKENIKIWMKKEALYALIADEMPTSVCNKLYKIELFKGIEFPKGRTFEDLATLYKILDQADKIVEDKEIGYYYVQRKSSIIHSSDSLSMIDSIQGIDERYDYLMQKYIELKDILVINKLYCIMGCFKNFYNLEEKGESLKEILKEEYQFYKKYYKQYKKELIKNVNINKNLRRQLELQLLYFNKRIFGVYSLLLNQVKKLRNIWKK